MSFGTSVIMNKLHRKKVVGKWSVIPNEFGTVFELGVQRLETGQEELEIQYLQSLAKPE